MSIRKKIAVVAIGAAVGFINGFFGGGGGMLLVPILTYVLCLEQKQAHATALMIIFPMSLASSITYAVIGEVNYLFALYVAIGGALGGILGAFVLKKGTNVFIEILFIGVIMASALYMLIK